MPDTTTTTTTTTGAAPSAPSPETPPASLVAELAATMPAPTMPPPAPAGGKTPPAGAPAPTPAAAAVKDSLGRTFDRVRFAVGPDGLPRFDKLGRFFSANLGRKPAAGPAAAPARAPVAASFVAPDDPAPTVTPGADAAGPVNGTVETCIGILQTVFVLIGQEEGIFSDTEKALLRPPIERILAKYNIGADVIPAELELALAVVAIVIERIKKGRRFATWFAKVRAGVVEFFFRRKGDELGATIRQEVGPDLVASLSAEVRRARDEVAAMRAQLAAEAAAAGKVAA